MTYEEKKQLAHSYLQNKESENDYRPFFNMIYPFTTENLTGFFNAELVKDKKILLTGSSGDQILTSQLYDAKKITHFDINPFAKYMYELKKAAIKELCIYDFLYYFYYNLENSESFRFKEYEKIRNSLEGESLDFWDSLYENYSPLKIRKRLFILSDEERMNKYFDIIPYMKRDNYELLKNKDFIPVDFVECNLLQLANNIKDKYDVLYFSNILGRIEMSYFFSDDYIINIYKFMRGILNITEDEGKILLNYFYNFSKKDVYDKSNEDSIKYIQYPVSRFNCMNNIDFYEMNSISEHGRDTVMVYTKK